MLRGRWSGGLGRDLAVDLGTATTLVHRQGRGLVVDEPSVVALDARSGALVAAGEQAREMLGRTPGTMRAVRPLRGGVLAEPDAGELLLRCLTERAGLSSVLRPRMVLAVPCEITGVERRAIEEAALRVGARRVHLVEEATVAAIGAGLPITDTAGVMVVDIGAGSTDAAILSLGGVVAARSTRIAGDALDVAIVEHVRTEVSLLLGERSAEAIKVSIGSAYPLAAELTTRVRGRDLRSGLPRTVDLGSAQVRRALDRPVRAIVDLARQVLDGCPPELAGDVLSRGITLTGGAARLRGLDARMAHDLGVPVTVAEAPQRAVVRGLGRCVDHLEELRPLLLGAPGA